MSCLTYPFKFGNREQDSSNGKREPALSLYMTACDGGQEMEMEIYPAWQPHVLGRLEAESSVCLWIVTKFRTFTTAAPVTAPQTRGN